MRTVDLNPVHLVMGHQNQIQSASICIIGPATKVITIQTKNPDEAMKMDSLHNCVTILVLGGPMAFRTPISLHPFFGNNYHYETYILTYRGKKGSLWHLNLRFRQSYLLIGRYYLPSCSDASLNCQLITIFRISNMSSQHRPILVIQLLQRPCQILKYTSNDLCCFDTHQNCGVCLKNISRDLK